MEIQKIFSEIDTEEKLYSVLMSEDELSFFSEIQKEFTSKEFKAIKRAKILKEIGTHENGGGFLGSLKLAARHNRPHNNMVAERSVRLDRKLMKKGIEKSPLELSNDAAVSTQRELARGGYAKSDVVPLSKPGKKGYTRNSKDGEIVDMYKGLKKINPEAAHDMVDYKKSIRDEKKKELAKLLKKQSKTDNRGGLGSGLVAFTRK